MNKKIFKKMINKKLPASAMLMSLAVFGIITIIAFGSAYISIINMSKGSSFSDSAKARKMAESGAERFKYEVYRNNFNINSYCLDDIFVFSLNNSSYRINCDNSSGQNTFYSVGYHKNARSVKRIDLKNPFVCGDLFTDQRDGNVYKSVQIGTQCWMAENLKYFPVIHDSIQFTEQGNNNLPAYTVINYNLYGVLYNWQAANISCPDGWHLASRTDWDNLVDYLNINNQYWCEGTSGQTAKSLASTSTWPVSTNICSIGNNISLNNIAGFNALPAGGIHPNGSGYNFELGSFFWSSSYDPFTPQSSLTYNLSFDRSIILSTSYHNSYGFSVRCIKN